MSATATMYRVDPTEVGWRAHHRRFVMGRSCAGGMRTFSGRHHPADFTVSLRNMPSNTSSAPSLVNHAHTR